MRRPLSLGVSIALTVLGCHTSDDAPSEPTALWEAGTPAPVDAATPDAAEALCVDGVAVYPHTTSIAFHAALPDRTFAGIDASGAPSAVALHDFFEPCAARSRLLVVRVSAAWCGTCRWDAAHTTELLALDVGARLIVLDLVIAGADNAPPVSADLAAWQGRIDAPRGSTKIALDPDFTLGPLYPARAPLPMIALVDTRTMTVRNVLDDPDPDRLALRIHQELAVLDGAPLPPPTASATLDGRFTRNRWDMIHDMGGLGAPPPDPTNAKGDDPAAAALGGKLFADMSLAPGGQVSCGKCHDAGQGFGDGLPQSMGVSKVDRNAPSVMFAAYTRSQFWDGRADSLWMQALGPFENEKEIAGSRLFVAHAIYDRYKDAYEAIFGALPALSDAARFPPSGKPGDAAWSAMAPEDQLAVTRVFVNVGKSIAAFERTFRAKPNPLDAYAAGALDALTTPQKDGLRAFFDAGCAQCHYGPRLTDDAFHAVRFPTGRQDGAADRGRIDGVPQLLASPFNAGGAFSDAPAPLSIVVAPSMLGAFKTPALRGVPASAPYGHGGTLATLAEVAKNYSTSGLDDASPLAVGPSEPWLPRFDDPTRDALPAFLSVLTAQATP